MLKKILAISGRPGLFKLISQGKNCLIVESLIEHKRIPAFNNERVMSLGDIAIYTAEDEVPLSEVFESVKNVFGGEKVEVNQLEKAGELRKKFAEILPSFDEDRVKNTDIRKVFNWYNILLNEGITEYKEEEPRQEEDVNEESKVTKE